MPKAPAPRDDVTHARLAAIVNSSNNAIVSKDLDGTIRSWNPAAEMIFGYAASEIIGQSVFILIPEDLHDEERAILARVAAGERIEERETARIRKDGKRIPIAVSVSPLRDRRGRLIGASSIKRDIGVQRSLEAQLRQAQKMEAVGRLAGGVAHDFNNLLSVILGYGELMAQELSDGHPLSEPVNEILAAGRRASELTGQLLAFSRQRVLDLRILDVNEVIRDAENLLKRTIGEDIQMECDLSTEPSRCKADSGSLVQVLMNLAVNARDAMPNGGKLLIETENVELDAEYTLGHAEAAAGSYVRVSVTDTGIGMDQETQSRIFEPFYTTKPEGKGTGLGLSTVFGIVKQVGGNIWVYSEPGRGTTFKIYLPRTAEAAQPRAIERVAAPRPRGSETILLVEDDEPVRKLARGILKREGYRVLEAANGGEALLICEQHDERIDLLLTDVVMPRMSGRELAERLDVLRPGIVVLYMSGYSERAVVHHGVLDSGINYLSKPITPTSLLAKVREVLAH